MIRSGDVPEALTLLDGAGERYGALGVTVPDLTVDRLIGAKKAPRAQFHTLQQGLLKAGLKQS